MIVITFCVLVFCLVRIQSKYININIYSSFSYIENSDHVKMKTNDSYEKVEIMTTPQVCIAYHTDDKLHTVSNAAYSTVQHGVN